MHTGMHFQAAEKNFQETLQPLTHTHTHTHTHEPWVAPPHTQEHPFSGIPCSGLLEERNTLKKTRHPEEFEAAICYKICLSNFLSLSLSHTGLPRTLRPPERSSLNTWGSSQSPSLHQLLVKRPMSNVQSSNVLSISSLILQLQGSQVYPFNHEPYRSP